MVSVSKNNGYQVLPVLSQFVHLVPSSSSLCTDPHPLRKKSGGSVHRLVPSAWFQCLSDGLFKGKRCCCTVINKDSKIANHASNSLLRGIVGYYRPRLIYLPMFFLLFYFFGLEFCLFVFSVHGGSRFIIISISTSSNHRSISAFEFS